MKVVVSKEGNILYEAVVETEDLVNGGDLFFGREEDCHIVLDSFLISRHHASMKIEEQNLIVECLSNQGSIKVDGVESQKAVLKENSKIEIGEYEITLSQLDFLASLIPEEEESILDGDDLLSDEDYLNAEPELSPVDVTNVTDDTVMLENDVLEETDDILADASELDLTNQLAADDEALEDDPILDGLDDETLVDPNEDLGEELLSEDGDDLFNESTQVDNFNDEESPQDEEFADQDFDDDNGFEDESDQESSEQSDDAFGDDAGGFEDDGGFDDAGGFDDDGGFGDDGGFDDNGGFEDEDEGATQVLSTFASYSLKIFGEFAPYDSYIISEQETFIGRDPGKCQIALGDEEVSKVHAVIKKTILGCTIEDLDSSNGIILNGERVNKAELAHNDEFLIGDTTFTLLIESDIIKAEQGKLMPVQRNQEIEVVEEVEEEVDFDEFAAEGGGEFGSDLEPEEKSVLKKWLKDPKKKRILMIVGVLLAALIFIEPEEEAKKPAKNPKAKAVKQAKAKNINDPQSKYSPEQLNMLEQDYALALSQYENGQFNEALLSLDAVSKIDPNYKKTQTLKKLIQEGLDEIVRLKQQEQEEAERKERQLKVSNYLEKAREAVKERNVTSANNFFSLIFELDPENPDVPPLKMEIEAYVEDQKRKKQEEELAKARRQAMVDKLAPGKTLYIKKLYYKAIDRLEKYINDKNIDEDLLTEATRMLEDSRVQLQRMIRPLISKARSFKEGQDLKQAFETYGEVLKIDPTNEEALNERDLIVTTLRTRAMKIYREALIAESLSLFEEAKEKFQEVQQVSPINSEYYVKATEKLKNYLE
jgi:pSer/pThr/pTyr-binding forkhead associated (FHA) protein